MGPHKGYPPNSYPQRPIESPFQTIDLGLVESGALRSAWNPEREEGEDKSGSWRAHSLSYDPSGSVRSRFSTSSAGSIRKPTILEKIRGENIGWLNSLHAILFSSWVNILILVIPVLWTLRFLELVSDLITFILSFFALIPIIKLLDFSSENLAIYCGPAVGDLILISLNNAVEAILALWLLATWQPRLLQSSIIGVIVLRLLLIPGVSFIVGGARISSQELHPHVTGLNHSLLTMGVLAFLLPIVFFTAMIISKGAEGSFSAGIPIVSDHMRGELLKVSRGMAVILLIIYICSRFFIHHPRGDDNAWQTEAPEELKKRVEASEEEAPSINFSMSVIVSLICVGLMAITAEMLVDSIEVVKDNVVYSEEWFGLILLPLVSFSADALVSIANFVRSNMFGHSVPHTMASYRHVDDAIQFLMFWAPVLVLLGWALQRPMSLLFDLFEVTILVGSCFLLNYVTADSKTNWAEGSMLVALYIMIALTAWFYPQQPVIAIMLSRNSVADALKSAEQPSSTLGTPMSSSNVLYTVTATPTTSVTSFVTHATQTATSSSAKLNQVLSEELQELIKAYKILDEDIHRAQLAIESKLSAVATTSSTATSTTARPFKTVSSRAKRSVQIFKEYS
ncbi:hypothetical protein D9757_000296 [Collybiopsis confluens]|uniref:Sodium/calcium exchanger membrane region domain-containing protein n=1 Tax=Collybiopsis confluens TaxID=2823264 RepID=A0A8H5I1Y6_9AGAR|nr:hypothetical protein D9757_000296 [Collybiopsis confluens]